MNNALRWLPAVMKDDPYTSMVHIDDANKANGPLSGRTDGYWFDLKDLLLYGEQFSNFALTANDGAIALPAVDNVNKRYPTLAMAQGLFANSGKTDILEDGVISLTILGSQKDTTPSPSPIGI